MIEGYISRERLKRKLVLFHFKFVLLTIFFPEFKSAIRKLLIFIINLGESRKKWRKK